MRPLVAALLALVVFPPSLYARESSDPLPRSIGSLTVKVMCKDGAFYRGEPIEVVPKDHITLQLIDGKTKRIDWNKISKVDGLPATHQAPKKSISKDDDEEIERAPTLNAKTRSEASLPVSQQQVTTQSIGEQIASMPTSAGVQSVMMRVDGVRAGMANIEYRPVHLDDGTTSWDDFGWRPACTLPCLLRADPQARFRVSGQEITTSSPFYLPTKGTRFNVVVDPGSTSTRIAAIVVFSLSGAFALLSSSVFIAMPSNGSESVQAPYWQASVALAATGLLSVFIGGPLMGASSTSVKVQAAD